MTHKAYAVSRFIYSVLLLGYPKPFRSRFAEQMRRDFDEQLVTNGSLGPLRGRFETWKRAGRDLLASMPRERLRIGQPMLKKNHEGPRRRRNLQMGSLLADLRFAFRLWRKSPGFVAIAALTIALGIGATTTIFSVANSLLIRTPTGVRDPGGLVTVFTRTQDGSREGMFSYTTFASLRDSESGLSDFSALALFMGSISTGLDAEPELVAGLAVSANYFRILGTRPHQGRFFAADEDVVPSANHVAVLGHRLWVQRFGADSSIVGRTVNINRVSFTVVGVAEEGFQGHVTGYEFGVWVPLGSLNAVVDQRAIRELIGIGRLAPDASFSQVSAAFAVASQRLQEQHPEDFGARNLVVSPYGGMIDFARGPVTMLMVLLLGISGIVLLIACVNVAGMLLSRASARSREIAVRLAIGASRAVVIRQLLTESVLLFLLGGGLGTAFAVLATDALGMLRPPVPVPLLISFAPDMRVLAFTLTVALLTGVVFGLAPALQATKPDIVVSLKDEGGIGHSGRGSMRSVFVVAQVTGSVVLLVLAGVFARALSQADSVDLGFDPTNVHVYSVDVSLHHYSQEDGRTYFRDLRERAAALPGVESAALAWVIPMGFDYVGTDFSVPGWESPDGEESLGAGVNAVSQEYFETLRIGFAAGRGFTNADREGTNPVVVVNETAAARFWPGEHAVGKQLQSGDTQYEVIGVANDGTYRTLGEDPRPMVFMAQPQRYSSNASLVVRTMPGRADLTREIGDVARTLDADLPAQTNAPFVDVIGASLLPNRAAAATAGAFGVLGLLLAAVGLYGILSYTVSMRLREIGIRIALGADSATIRMLVLGDGLKLVGVGIGVGLPIAFGTSMLTRSLLFGLSPADPLTFGGIVILFVGVALLASYVPARRATMTDPIAALRSE